MATATKTESENAELTERPARRKSFTRSNPNPDDVTMEETIPEPDESTVANVRTTVSYAAKIKKNQNQNQNESHSGRNAPSDNGVSGLPHSYASPFQSSRGHSPTNRIADLFDELSGYADDSDQVFYALITRRADMMNDNFRYPALAAQNFPPFQITPSSMMNFVATIQRYNQNSGGRFDVVICNENGESTDIGLTNLVIPNPIVEERSPQSNESTAMVDLMREMMQKSDERFAQLVMMLREEPKKDRLAMLMEKKIEQEIINPQPREAFTPERMIEQIFTSQVMIQTLSEKMSAAFDKPTTEREKTTLEMLLSNDAVISKAGDLMNNIAAIANNAVLARQQAAQAQAYQQAQNPAANPDGYPPLPPEQATEQPNAPESAPVNDMAERQQMIELIIAELESDRAIGDDNEFLKELAVKYPDLANGLSMLCVALPFESLVDQLEEALPHVFEEFYSNTEEKDADGATITDLNERGKKVHARLREFYDYMQAKAMQAKAGK
jgi:hypothetical protein